MLMEILLHWNPGKGKTQYMSVHVENVLLFMDNDPATQ